jgi:hypothetical protein
MKPTWNIWNCTTLARLSNHEKSFSVRHKKPVIMQRAVKYPDVVKSIQPDTYLGAGCFFIGAKFSIILDL